MAVPQDALTFTAVLLILASAALHGWWNYIFKHVGGDEAVLAASIIVECVVLLPFVIYFLLTQSALARTLVLLGAGGSVLVFANYRLLAGAYRRIDLSIGYPIARGSVLLFLPLLGWIVFGERLTPLGIVGVAAVATGVLLQARKPNTDLQHGHRTAGVAFAIAAALCTAGYTIWDKHAVQMIPPLVYFTTYTCFLSVAYIISIRREKGPGVVRRAWNEHRSSAILIGFGNAASYVLFLIALRSGVSSYVIGLRQLSIAFGVFLGWRFLGERVTMNRAAGIALLIAGCILILVTTQ